MYKMIKVKDLLDDRILVDPDEPDSKTRGGILLPDTAKQKPVVGTVVAVGPGKVAELSGVKIPMNLKVGDRVLYMAYGGADVEIDGYDHKLKIMHERECVCTLEKGAVPAAMPDEEGNVHGYPR